MSKEHSFEDSRRWRQRPLAASACRCVAWDHYAARTSVTMTAGAPPFRSSGGEPIRRLPARFPPAAKSCRDCVRFPWNSQAGRTTAQLDSVLNDTWVRGEHAAVHDQGPSWSRWWAWGKRIDAEGS